MDTVKIDHKSTLMVAHRGLSGIERENTIAAFVAAGNRSYYGIETDIHKTSDGKFIVIHDSNTSRVSGVSCNIEGNEFNILRSIYLKDTGNKKERIDLRLPSLEEYIRVCKRYNKKCILEIKGDMLEEDILKIVEIIKEEEYLEGVIFISFTLQNLVYLRKNYPDQPAQYLFNSISDDIWNALQEYKLDIDMEGAHLTRDIVEKAHSLGIKVNCWTINGKEDGERFVDYGVDFITTNILE